MPKIKAVQTASNHLDDGAWCPGCGLYAHVNDGRHRADCTLGVKHRAGDTPTERPA